MKYKKFTFEMKKKIVAEAMQAKSFKSVSIKYGVARSTLGGWLSDDELNPDKRSMIELDGKRRTMHQEAHEFQLKSQRIQSMKE